MNGESKTLEIKDLMTNNAKMISTSKSNQQPGGSLTRIPRDK